MGVTCQINLQKPPDGVFRSADFVKGTVKYAVEENMVYTKITVALKGKGKVEWREHVDKTTIYYSGTEKYVNSENVILEDKSEKGMLLQKGSYSATFHFVLPDDIPPTYKDSTCTICYYVCMTFIRPGMLNATRKFKSELTVVCNVSPISGPLTCVESKSLTDYLRKSKSVIKINGTLTNQVVQPGNEAVLNFSIENDTDVNIKRVTINVVEKRTYTALFYGKTMHTKKKIRKLEGCKKVIEEIAKKSTHNCTMCIATLDNRYTIADTKIFNRTYKIVVTAKIPFPHRNAVLKIPLTIGELKKENVSYESEPELPIEDAPPSYWEVMLEDEMQNTSKRH